MTKEYLFVILILLNLSCNNKKPEIETTLSLDSSNQIVRLQFKNKSEKNYYFWMLPPQIRDTTIGRYLDFDTNIPCLNLVKVEGYINKKIQDSLLYHFIKLTQKTSDTSSYTYDSTLFRSYFNDSLEFINYFVLVPKKSFSTYFYKIKVPDTNKLYKIKFLYPSMNNFFKKSRVIFQEFYSTASSIYGFEPYIFNIDNILLNDSVYFYKK